MEQLRSQTSYVTEKSLAKEGSMGGGVERLSQERRRLHIRSGKW